MTRILSGLAGLLMALTSAHSVAQTNGSYAVLIISRERLELATSCEVGIYLNDQLASRLFQEQSTSFNLPPGPVDVRLRLLPGQTPGCAPGIEDQRSTRLQLSAGRIDKYRIAMGHEGLVLKKADLGY